MPELYYHIEWPESQKWFEEIKLLEEEYVYLGSNGDCFVSKEVYEKMEGKK